MEREPPKLAKDRTVPTRQAEREARLAAALRANLRRRKAQARARAEEEAPAGTGAPSREG